MEIRVNFEDNKNIFFISDFHLFHKNVIKFDNRPFIDKYGNPDVDAMHKTIITNWNNVITDNDVVFYLGDLCFANIEKATNIVYALKGKIHFIMGNHDRYRDISKLGRFETINDLVDLTIKSSKFKETIGIQLCHYPIYSWRNMLHNWYMIHGHTHGNLHHGEEANFYNGRKVMDVGCNLIDYTPLPFLSAINKMETRFNKTKN